MEHDEQEIERLLRENLKLNRENNDYIKRVDRRQRWDRNWKAFYWAVILAAAVFGTFYAFPYLKEVRETLSGAWDQISAFASFTDQNSR